MSVQVRNLGSADSLLNTFVAELRDTGIQRDPLRFRSNLGRIGALMGYEISRELGYRARRVATPLGELDCRVLAEQPVLAAILRAALPLHQGLLSVFDRADNAFVSAYRKHADDGPDFEVEVEYLASPGLDGRTVILCDPMLATGTSMVLAWKALLARGQPARLHVVAVIASQAGIDCLREQLPDGSTVWVAAIDAQLDARAYIVPGLGDAGDLAYGARD